MAGEVRAALRPAPPLTVIDLSGEVTSFADEAITRAYRQASEQGASHILLHFGGVDYINSAGVAVLIGVLAEARKAGQQILVCGLTPHYRKIFQMMGLAGHALLFDTEDEARRAVSQL